MRNTPIVRARRRRRPRVEQAIATPEEPPSWQSLYAQPKECVICGGQFAPNGSTKTCSAECHAEHHKRRRKKINAKYTANPANRNKTNARRRKNYPANRDKINADRRARTAANAHPKHCVIDGKWFIPKGKQKTCSPECSKALAAKGQARRARKWRRKYYATRQIEQNAM